MLPPCFPSACRKLIWSFSYTSASAMTPPDSFTSAQCSEQSERDMIHGITNTLLKIWKYNKGIPLLLILLLWTWNRLIILILNFPSHYTRRYTWICFYPGILTINNLSPTCSRQSFCAAPPSMILVTYMLLSPGMCWFPTPPAILKPSPVKEYACLYTKTFASV